MVSKKHRTWHNSLREKWRDVEIRRCEFPGCTQGLFLTPAHSRKRREIENEQQYHEIAWLCEPHHLEVERLSHGDMEIVIREIIQRREQIDTYTTA